VRKIAAARCLGHLVRRWKRFRTALPTDPHHPLGLYAKRPATAPSPPGGVALQVDHPKPRGVGHRVGAAGGIELVEQRADVEFGGVNGYSEPSRDGLV
jgi:hypothetical protein